MKWLKVFALFTLLHLIGWIGAHWYKGNNPDRVLLVADTSFAMKPHFADMRSWIDDYVASSRYTDIVVGTDKALIGDLDQLKSTDAIFRVSFGRSTAESLVPYSSEQADEKILLSDGSFNAPGWNLVKFE